MAAKITDEQKIQINELYLELGVKAQVARALGVSAASVSKYIIPNYVSQKDRIIEKFEGQPTEISNDILNIEDKAEFATALISLSKEEKEDLKKLQKEIFI